jgi:lipopolysaccharide biosynthesis glycosyltransferase
MKSCLNFVFTIDERYLQHFTVTLTSLIENNQYIVLNVYLIHDFTDLSKLNNVLVFFEKYDINISLLSLNNSLFDQYTISHHISKAVYFRLLMSDIIPDNVDSVIYLDSDIVITGSLKKLVDFDFKNKYLYAVSDIASAEQSIIRLNEIGVPATKYFNSGVMLINLKMWRDSDVSKNLILTAEKYRSKLQWWDQDVLNIYFYDKWEQLPYKYNANAINKRLDEIPLIIHYTSSSKPWQYLNNHPYKKYYWQYLRLTPFKNFRYKDITLKNLLKKVIYFNKQM